jgi:hypothetical protein
LTGEDGDLIITDSDSMAAALTDHVSDEYQSIRAAVAAAVEFGDPETATAV